MLDSPSTMGFDSMMEPGHRSQVVESGLAGWSAVGGVEVGVGVVGVHLAAGVRPIGEGVGRGEDEDGFTRLYILVDPGLGALDEREVLACVEETLSTHHPIGSTVWKKAGTIRLRRASPILTQAGKLMPLHHLGQARSTVE